MAPVTSLELMVQTDLRSAATVPKRLGLPKMAKLFSYKGAILRARHGATRSRMPQQQCHSRGELPRLNSGYSEKKSAVASGT
jgi:hypothetical protein